MDLGSEALPLESIPIVKVFLEALPDDLHGVPPEREINFGIDILTNTKHISIPPYRKDPIELK